MEFFNQFAKQAGAVFGKLDAKQKMVVAFVSLISVSVIVYLMAWTGERQFTTLHSGLQPEDAQTIVQYLKEEGVQYRLEDDGTAIMVEQGTELELRMEIAAEGMVTGGTVGYELFDQQNLGVTDFMQQVNFKRSIEGEIARTITSLEIVESARVLITTPKPSLFIEDKLPATASIVLQTKAGTTLSAEQINSIAKLVANSVEGLLPAHVKISDSYGNDLSQVINTDPLLSMRADQLRIEREKEILLKTRLTNLMSDVLGPNSAIVEVAVELDFTQSNTTSKIYGPVEPIIRSQETEEAGGGTSDTSQTGSTNERITTNNEINESVTNSVDTFGEIKRMSVSVMVNGYHGEDANGNDIYTPRPQVELDNLRQSVISAVGFDAARGDQISVVDFQFDNTMARTEMDRLAAANRENLISRILKWVMMAVAGLAFVFVLKSVFHSLDLLLPKPKPKPAIDIEAEAIEEEISAEAQRRAQMLDQVSRFTKEKPSNVASLLNTWLIAEEKQ